MSKVKKVWFKLLNERIDRERELREMAIAYERKITDQQFAEVQTITREHRVYHDREHVLYDDAVEKAAAALHSQLGVVETDLERLRDQSHTFMTQERFDREHSSLAEKNELAIKTLADKLGAEEKVTVRQDATQQVLDKITLNNRWLIGTAVTVTLTLLTTVLHLMKII